jgi:transposase-like protein
MFHEKIIDLAINPVGVRDTAQLLKISSSTVIRD